jgi:predicted phage terminase large subunit-like protein
MEKVALEALREMARQDLAFYAEYASRGRWKPYPYLVWLAQQVQERLERGGVFIIVELPPRHGKSELFSIYLPSWWRGRRPEENVLLVSYGADLAQNFSYRAREVFREMGPELWSLELSQASSSKSTWESEGHHGQMNAAGVGGPITGKGAHLAIIDDPVKGWEDAHSRTFRERSYEWYQSVFRTRLEPGGSVLLIMTRWHEDDLAGRLIRQRDEGQGDPWEVLKLPAVAEEGDPLGREPGQALSPDRYGEQELIRIRSAVGAYVWEALYQQRPRQAEGELFSRQDFRYFRREGDLYVLEGRDGVNRYPVAECWTFQACDPAVSTKASADWFVLGTFAATPHNDLLVLDICRDRLEGPDQPALLRRYYERFRPAFQAVESGALGLSLYQAMVRAGLPVRELKAEADKRTRALPVAARYQAGTVYHLAGAPWLDDLEEELLAFPHGAHDDQVDVVAYAAIILAEKASDAYEEALDGMVDLGI